MVQMTAAAKRAYVWASAHVTPGSIWCWKAPDGQIGEVQLTILAYETIGDPQTGCTFSARPDEYQVTLNGGGPQPCGPLDLPGWFRSMLDGGAISALRMKEQVDAGTLCRIV